jgi:hypothetical protein
MSRVSGVVILLSCLAGLAVIRAAAKRFEARQRRKARWDDHGPMFPTEGPPLGRGHMGERLEVTGRWIPRPIERELPTERGRPDGDEPGSRPLGRRE